MLEKKIQQYYRELQEKIDEMDQNKILKICKYLKKKILDKKFKVRVICLLVSSSMITTISNYVSFEKVFEYQLNSLYDKNDYLIF
tara:strand:+ start:340 stop:594 length:255 start_codon:yes stop_codon:yes gene_type:complete